MNTIVPTTREAAETLDFLRGIQVIETLVQSQADEFLRQKIQAPPVDGSMASSAANLTRDGANSAERLSLLLKMLQEIARRQALLATHEDRPEPIALDAFVGAAHKIRTALDLVLNCGEEIADLAAEHAAIESIIEPAKEITVAARWAVHYAKELSDLAQLEQGGPPSRARFMAAEAVKSVVEHLMPLANSADIKLTSAGDDAVIVEVDRKELEQCLHYLTLLAIGGRRVANVSVEVRANADAALFMISHDGEYASLDDLARLVGGRQFSQELNADGAGFAVARRLANRLGSRICMAPRPGRGALVEISIPLCTA